MNNNSDFDQLFGKHVTALRVEAGLSQKRLAEIIDVNQTSISFLENAKRVLNINANSTVLVIKALSITPEDITMIRNGEVPDVSERKFPWLPAEDVKVKKGLSATYDNAAILQVAIPHDVMRIFLNAAHDEQLSADELFVKMVCGLSQYKR